MLRLQSAQVDELWDTILPEEVRVLPSDLERLDELLSDPALLAPIRARWLAEDAATGRCATADGRPTIPMATYVRLMVVKHRCSWGYETLVGEVSDSLHLRRFCLIGLHQQLPDESTVRKMTRRLGSAVVDELIRGLIGKAARERRFAPRAMRCDSTVAESDIRYPTDAGLAREAARLLARESRKLARITGRAAVRIRDRSRAVGQRMRAVTRTLRRRTGEAKKDVLALVGQAGELVAKSVRAAQRAAGKAKAAARGRGAQKKLEAVRRYEELIERSQKLVEQIRKRVRGEKITDRLVSFHDSDARPVRRGKIAKPTEFGYVVQLTELTANTKPGARGLIVPPKVRAGSTHDNTLLPESVAELVTVGLRPKEATFDGGFQTGRTEEAMADVGSKSFITGRTTDRSKRSARRLRRYRTGCEGRISHLKRSYGAGRSRLRGTEGARIWESWAVFTYDAVTVASMAARSGSPTR